MRPQPLKVPKLAPAGSPPVLPNAAAAMGADNTTVLPAPLAGYVVRDGTVAQVTVGCPPNADVHHFDTLIRRLQERYVSVVVVATTENIAERARQLGFADTDDAPVGPYSVLSWSSDDEKADLKGYAREWVDGGIQPEHAEPETEA